MSKARKPSPHGSKASKASQAAFNREEGCSCLYCHRQFGTLVLWHGKNRFLERVKEHALSRVTGGTLTVSACQICTAIKCTLIFSSVSEIQDYCIDALLAAKSITVEHARRLRLERAAARESDPGCIWNEQLSTVKDTVEGAARRFIHGASAKDAPERTPPNWSTFACQECNRAFGSVTPIRGRARFVLPGIGDRCWDCCNMPLGQGRVMLSLHPELEARLDDARVSGQMPRGLRHFSRVVKKFKASEYRAGQFLRLMTMLGYSGPVAKAFEAKP